MRGRAVDMAGVADDERMADDERACRPPWACGGRGRWQDGSCANMFLLSVPVTPGRHLCRRRGADRRCVSTSRAMLALCPHVRVWGVVVVFGLALARHGVRASCQYDGCQDAPLYTCSLDYCTTTTAFELADKGLYGTIPSSVTLLTNLASLNLANNSLSGEIPVGIGSMSSLHVLRLDGNSLSGELPPSLGSLNRVTDVSVFGNELVGSIPASVGSLSNLQSLDLSQNKLGGVIPESMCQLESHAEVLLNNVWCGMVAAESIRPFAPPSYVAFIDCASTNPSACASRPSMEWWEQCDSSTYYYWDVDARSGDRRFGCSHTQEYVVGSAVYSCLDYFGSATTIYSNMTVCLVNNVADVSKWSAFAKGLSYQSTAQNFYQATSSSSSFVYFSNGSEFACNINGTMKLQTFACPLPTACANWLRDECGAGACAVDYDDVMALNDTVADLGHTTAEQQATLDSLEDTMAGNTDDLDSVTTTLDAQAATITELRATVATLNTTVLSQASSIASILARLDELDACCSRASFVPATPDPCDDDDSIDCTTTSPSTAPNASLDRNDGQAGTTNDVGVMAGFAAGGVAALAVGVGVAVWYSRRKRGLRGHLAKHGDGAPKAVSIPLLDVAFGHADADADAIVDSIASSLRADTTQWGTVEAVAGQMVAYHRLAQDAHDAHAATLTEATAILRTSLGENKLLMDHAAQSKDFATASLYSERVRLLTSVLPSDDDDDDDHDADSGLECVLPGLLLRKDRFQDGSDALLGRGASASVSRGVWADGQVRHVVAVKEIAKSGSIHEARAVSEFHLLARRLGNHGNIVRILNVKATSSTVYVLMECCAFSLDKQPEAFQRFLHGDKKSSGGSGGGGDKSGGDKSSDTTGGDALVGRLVLNALVQDLVRGVSFLHSKNVAHCDIKPANVLCAFDRSGKVRAFKSKYFKEARLKLTDFGVSRVLATSTPSTDGDHTTATVSLDALKGTTGIAGTRAYMHPDLLVLIDALTKGDAKEDPEVDAALLITNDTFGVGCVVGYLCSRGLHPFQSVLCKNIPANIRAHRRMKLRDLDIADTRHAALVDRFTTWKPKRAWTVTQALTRSPVFDRGGGDAPSDVLLDRLAMFQRPAGSCEQELLAPRLGEMCPLLPEMMDSVREAVQRLLAEESSLPKKLDPDSYFALVAYTMDNGVDRDSNVYFALNNALRNRKTDPGPFRAWQGFLFYLMRALDQLPAYAGVVYRGGNEGVDQATVRRDYPPGRPVQWAAFSSTSQSAEATKEFVDKAEGVLFTIKVVTGRDVGRYSYFPKESEILLSPNTTFAVTSELYADEDGYARVDLAETAGSVLTS